MGKRGREYVQTRYTRSEQARALEKLLEGITKGSE
jgi:hypothetical protein